MQPIHAPDILSVDKLDLIGFQSRIEKCERLAARIPGAPNIYIKRDDLIGVLCGGNKLRKLEYVMADALRQRATTIVTVGAIQSNHARVTAMACRQLGIKCVLVLNGQQPEKPRGNFLLDQMLGATIRLVQTRDERSAAMNEVAHELTKRGERVYVVPLGASDRIGSLGFVEAARELKDQQQALGVEFDYIIQSSSSGGTQAGLEVGRKLYGMDRTTIIGVSPDDGANVIQGRISAIVAAMESTLGIEGSVEDRLLRVDDQYVGAGYGVHSEKSEEAARLFREAEGILLDPVYTSKAAAALVDYCQKGMFRPGQNVLFWHTGGLVALFGQS